MKMHSISFLPGINRVKQFLSDDKTDGVKHAYYVWDYNQNGVIAFDTPALFQLNVDRYKSQNVLFSKKVAVPETTLQEMGVRSATIHVFRDINPNSVLTEFLKNGVVKLDYCGIAFGYVPAKCEVTIIEVEF
jgi:hypothetical protein